MNNGTKAVAASWHSEGVAGWHHDAADLNCRAFEHGEPWLSGLGVKPPKFERPLQIEMSKPVPNVLMSFPATFSRASGIQKTLDCVIPGASAFTQNFRLCVDPIVLTKGERR